MTGHAQKLEVSNLRVTGDGGRRLLSVDRLEIRAGSAVVVRGPSGAGKSTFLYALAGMIAPETGQICWGDTDIAPLPEAARAAFRCRNMGFVFQEHLVFEELSAAENAAIAALYSGRALRGKIRDRAATELVRLGLGGVGTRRSDTFSGGERQRIAVARALAGDPGIILADEPTASLDRDNADRLAEDLVTLARTEGRTLIAVSHDPALHDRADRIIDIVDGRLLEGADG